MLCNLCEQPIDGIPVNFKGKFVHLDCANQLMKDFARDVREMTKKKVEVVEKIQIMSVEGVR